MQDLKKKMAISAGWMMLIMVCIRSLSLISIVILARLLTPEDFGLVALAAAIIGSLELMSAFSFDVVLIQNQNAPRAHYDTAWTIQILFALVSSLVLVGLAGPAGAFYEDARLTTIMYVLAIGVVGGGFQNIGIVAFRKDLEFHKEFMFTVIKKLAGFTVTVGLAFYLRSYWALVAGMVTTQVGGSILSYFAHPYRPRLATSAWSKLFGFSRWLFINNILGFLKHRASDFIVGKFSGPGGLGVFSLSYELASIPSSELAAPINRAVFPGYAKMADNLPRLRQSYLDVIQSIAMITIPAAVGIAILAEPIVMVALGDKWVDAIPLIRILGIASVITALESNIGAVYLALGKPQILTRLFSIYVIILLVFLVIGAREAGPLGAAWGVLAASIVNIPLYYTVMFRTLNIAILQFLAIIWRPFTSALIMLAVLTWLMRFLAEAAIDVRTLPVLLALIAVGAITYFVAIVGLWMGSGRPRGAERVVLDQARQILLRRLR